MYITSTLSLEKHVSHWDMDIGYDIVNATHTIELLPAGVAGRVKTSTSPILLVPAGNAGSVRTSTSPMLLDPAGKAALIVTAPVSTAVTFPFREARVASVEAPAGSGKEDALTGTVWSDAMFTGVEAAITAAP